MKLHTEEELQKFKEAVDNCHNPVLMLTHSGKEYDLKTFEGYSIGVAEFVKYGDTWKEPEIYASTHDDEATLLNFMHAYAA